MAQIAYKPALEISYWAQALVRPLRDADADIASHLARRLVVPASSLLFGAVSLIFCIAIFGALHSPSQAVLLFSAVACVLVFRIRTLGKIQDGSRRLERAELNAVLESALAYAFSIGIVTLLCALSDVPALIVLSGVLSTGMAFGATFAAAAAPRVARLQVLLILMPYVAALAFSNIPYMYFVTAQTPLWIFGIFVVNDTIHFQLADLIKSQQKNRRLALTDPLTGIANRAYMMSALKDNASAITGHSTFNYLLYLDLDGFKAVNDQLGHAAGDEVLISVGSQLQQVVRPTDEIARLGGDEFLILLRSVSVDDIGQIIRRLKASIGRPVQISGTRTASIGISIGGAPLTSDPIASIAFADANLYEVKRTRKGGHLCAFPTN